MEVEDIPDDWYFEIRDLTKDLAINTGFNWTNFYFRGFNCQGDGAVFDFDSVDIPLFIKSKNLKFYTPLLNDIKNGKIEVNFRSEQNSFATHYCHEKTRYTSYDYDVSDEKMSTSRSYHIETLILSLCNEIEKERLEICMALYGALEREWEGLLNV